MILYVVAAAAILFFALTRTEVGREGLRTQIERQFDRSFDGTIEIEELTGNLLNRLSARDVVVRDSSGFEVLRADSVLIHPSWRDLINRTISTGSITLIGPEIHLRRGSDGTWNMNALLGSRREADRNEPWAFRATRVRVINGRIITENTGAPPGAVVSGALFDYADTEFRSIYGRAVIDWGTDLKLIDVLELDGHLPQVGLRVDDLRGQIVLENDRLSLNETYLEIGNSSIHMNGSISSLASWRAGPGDVTVELDVAESVVDAGELSRLLPALTLRDVVTASLKIQGPLSELVVDHLTVERGNSVLTAEGTAVGLPDSLQFEVEVRPTSVNWQDLAAVWPTTFVPDFEHLGMVALSGFSEGVVRFGSLDRPAGIDASVNLRLDSRAGTLLGVGSFGVSHDGEFHVRGGLEASEFNAGLFLERSDLESDLNGRVDLDASGPSLHEASGDAVIGLRASSVLSRGIDTLSVTLRGDRRDLRGSFSAVTELGAAHVQAAASFSGGSLSYRLDGRTSDFNVGGIIPDDALTTSLNSQFSLVGEGVSLRTVEGTLALAFDSSLVTYGQTSRVVPPHKTNLALFQLESDNPRFELGGDVLDLTVTGDVALAPFLSLAREWTAAIRSGVDNEMAKSYRATQPLKTRSDTVRIAVYERAAASALGRQGLNAQHLSIQGRVLRSDIINALIPGTPDLRTNAAVSADVDVDERSLSFVMDFDADSLSFAGIRSDALTARLSVDLPSVRRLTESLTADLAIGSSRLMVGRQAFISPSLDADVKRKRINVAAGTRAEGAVDPFRFRAYMDLIDDRNRLTISDLQLAAGDQTWSNADSTIIDFYEEAAVVRGVRLERTLDDGSPSEHFYVEGTLSESPEDTLVVEADDILLEHVAGMLAVDVPVGGSVNGRLAFTGLRRQPELTGSVEIAPLTFENRLIGALSISSRYIPGSPDVALSLELRPDSSSRSDLIVHDNHLGLRGTFRLPGAALETGGRDPGSLDLDLIVEQADAFFFDYIFRGDVSDVSGHFAGEGHIGGTFVSPLFDAQLELVGGNFNVPEFNLAFTASGPVRVNEQGIHLHDVHVSDAGGGEALVHGSVLFNEYRYFSFDLHGALSDLRIMRVTQSRELPFYGNIRASGNLSLTGPLSSAVLRSENAVTSEDSDLYIPITESGEATDAGFIVFADSVGRLPDLSALTQRRGVLAQRPEGERPFLDGLEIDLNISAPEGSTVHLVIDPLLGDVINAVGSGRLQLVRSEGEFSTFGTFDVTSGDYLFTAGEVFFRRFLIDDGTITWDGDPLDAMLNIAASYRTRASPDGLGLEAVQEYIPLIIQMNVGGRVSTPSVDLSLALDRDDRNMLGSYESSIEAQLNQPEHVAQYATSVLLTNSFLLTTSAQSQLSSTRNQLAFNSLSQLVASQLNRYLNYALPNVDLSLGVQGESTQDLDVTYGVALRLLDERLVIRGEGIYQSDQLQRTQQGVLDEFVVEVRLNTSVSVEVFYRREGDPLDVQSLNTSTTGAGVSYQTEFPTWRRLIDRLFGWLITSEAEEAEEEIAAETGS